MSFVCQPYDLLLFQQEQSFLQFSYCEKQNTWAGLLFKQCKRQSSVFVSFLLTLSFKTHELSLQDRKDNVSNYLALISDQKSAGGFQMDSQSVPVARNMSGQNLVDVNCYIPTDLNGAMLNLHHLRIWLDGHTLWFKYSKGTPQQAVCRPVISL